MIEIILNFFIWVVMTHVKVIQALYKTIRYVFCRECIIERKILILLGLFFMLLLSKFIFLNVQYEFRLFALEIFVIVPGLYFLYFAPFWDEVVEYREFEKLLDTDMKQLEKEMKEFLPEVDEETIFSFVESRKKEIIKNIKPEEKIKNKREKISKELSTLSQNNFKKVMEEWTNENDR